jgi:hypothetical protein
MNAKQKAVLESYGRSFVVALAASYSSGETELKALAIAGLVAVIGPAIRAINPNDPAFGRVAEVVEVGLKKAAKKAPAKKAAKKPAK